MYILHYFNGQGRVETARLICAVGSIAYQDARLEFSQWPGDLKARLPFGSLPVLEVDGQFIGQSGAIFRYLAKEAGLTGETPLDALKIDSLAETVTEIREGAVSAMFSDDATKETKIQEFVKSVKGTLAKLEAYLTTNNGGDGYFVGEKLSWVDLHVVAVVEVAERVYPEGKVLDAYPKLAALNSRVRDEPRVAEYIQKRPETPF